MAEVAHLRESGRLHWRSNEHRIDCLRRRSTDSRSVVRLFCHWLEIECWHLPGPRVHHRATWHARRRTWRVLRVCATKLVAVLRHLCSWVWLRARRLHFLGRWCVGGPWSWNAESVAVAVEDNAGFGLWPMVHRSAIWRLGHGAAMQVLLTKGWRDGSCWWLLEPRVEVGCFWQ